jgi:hypothetical protein
MARFSTVMIFFVCITVALYMFGYKPLITNLAFGSGMFGLVGYTPADANVSTVTTYNVSTMKNNIGGSIADSQNAASALGLIGLIVLAVVGASLAVGLLTGFSANFLIPAIIFTLAMGVFYAFVPINFIFDATMPDIIRTPLAIILISVYIISVIDFIRGGA